AGRRHPRRPLLAADPHGGHPRGRRPPTRRLQRADDPPEAAVEDHPRRGAPSRLVVGPPHNRASGVRFPAVLGRHRRRADRQGVRPLRRLRRPRLAEGDLGRAGDRQGRPDTGRRRGGGRAGRRRGDRLEPRGPPARPGTGDPGSPPGGGGGDRRPDRGLRRRGDHVRCRHRRRALPRGESGHGRSGIPVRPDGGRPDRGGPGDRHTSGRVGAHHAAARGHDGGRTGRLARPVAPPVTMPTIPAALLRAIEEEIATVPLRNLQSRVAEMMSAYRSGDPAAAPLLDETGAKAYAAYRMPGTVAALLRVFAALTETTGAAPTSLVDVGGGTGAGMWAARAVWPSLEQVTVVDRS